MKTSDTLKALAFAYGYGLGGLEACPDDRDPMEEVSSWLSELIRKEREEAWDEGFSIATRNTTHSPHPMAEWNPYRKEKQ